MQELFEEKAQEKSGKHQQQKSGGGADGVQPQTFYTQQLPVKSANINYM